MNKFSSLETVIKGLATGKTGEASRSYRSLEASIRGVMRPQNMEPVRKRITDKEELSDEDLEHSRAADYQKKNKIIDNP